MTHTPGPWNIGPTYKSSINAGEKHIAMVNYWKSGDKSSDVFGEEHDANARLIAAAPDLLEALEANMEWIGPPPTDRHSYDSVRERAWKLGQAAIQKAKGE